MLGLAALALRGRWEAVGDAGGLPGIAPAVGAVAANLVGNALLATTWRRLVGFAGATIERRAALWAWAVSQLARYSLAGAQVVGRAVAGRRAGLTAFTGGATALVEIGWQTSVNAVVALGTLPWWLGTDDGLRWLALVAIVPAGILAVGIIAPKLLLRGLARVGGWPLVRRLTGGRLADADTRVALTRAGAAELTARYGANFGLRMAAFLLLFGGVGGSLRDDGLRAAGAFAVGQLVGRLAIFAPAGIGPREGATAILISPAVGGGPALLLVALTRLVEVVSELGFIAAARLARPERGA